MQRDLVEQAMAGDHDAFNELARAAIGRLYVVARLILRDDGRAEDATQEALVAAWRRLAGLRDPDRFEAWLHRLLVNACYREARSSRRRGSIEVHVDPLAMPEASDAPDDGRRPRRSRSARARLPTPRRGSANGARHALLPRVQPRRSRGGPRRPTGDRPLAAPSRDQRDARRARGRRPNPHAQRRTAGMTSQNRRATTSTGSCASGWTTTLSWRSPAPARSSARADAPLAAFPRGSPSKGGSRCNSRCRRAPRHGSPRSCCWWGCSSQRCWQRSSSSVRDPRCRRRSAWPTTGGLRSSPTIRSPASSRMAQAFSSSRTIRSVPRRPSSHTTGHASPTSDSAPTTRQTTRRCTATSSSRIQTDRIRSPSRRASPA